MRSPIVIKSPQHINIIVFAKMQQKIRINDIFVLTSGNDCGIKTIETRIYARKEDMT